MAYSAETSDLHRWQGVVDQRLDEHSRRLDGINGDARASREASEKILIEIAVLRTKIAIWATIGGLIGAGIVSMIVALVTG